MQIYIKAIRKSIYLPYVFHIPLCPRSPSVFAFIAEFSTTDSGKIIMFHKAGEPVIQPLSAKTT